jgi:hypothetical protein
VSVIRETVYEGESVNRSQMEVKQLATHLHLVPMSRKVELYLHSPIRLRGVVLN